MSDRAEARTPAQAAAEAVKAYVRINRQTLADDGELLSLLLPDRFRTRGISDLQRHIIEKLRDEIAQLRTERDALTGARDRTTTIGDGVKAVVLDLLDARTFEEAIRIVANAARALGAEHAVLCIESDAIAPKNCGVRFIVPGTISALLGRDSNATVLTNRGSLLLGPPGRDCRSIAIFRLQVGRETPNLLFVLGAREPGRFDGVEQTDLSFLAHALERSIRSWLDLPRR